MEVREATVPEMAAWRGDWRARLQSWHGAADVPAEWVSQQVEGRLASYAPRAQAGTFALTVDGAVIGIMALSAPDADGVRAALINDIWIAEPHRRNGRATEAIIWAEHWAQAAGATALWATTDPSEPAHAALFRRYPVRSHQMIKTLTEPGTLADGLESRPMSEPEFASWRADLVRGYAADMANSGTLPDAQAAVLAAAQVDQLLPDGRRTANQSFLSLCAKGEVVATNWLCHHRGPGISWVYDVEVKAEHRGKGYGRAAMTIGERAALGAGDTHLALNVFGHNEVAIRLYDSMGYCRYEDGRSITL
ncbi:MAG: GNAT family N-acetyltransferase [Streptosporangiaceae bacterium]